MSYKKNLKSTTSATKLKINNNKNRNKQNPKLAKGENTKTQQRSE